MSLRTKLYALLWGWQSVNLWQYRLPLLRYFYYLRPWVVLGQLLCVVVFLAILSASVWLWTPLALLIIPWYIPYTLRFPTDVVF